MKTHFSLLIGMPLAAMLVALPVSAQDKGTGAPAQDGTIATVNGKPIPQAKLEVLVRERVAQGQQDSPELRSFLNERLHIDMQRANLPLETRVADASPVTELRQVKP